LNNVKAFRDFFLQTIKLNNSFYKINGELADAYREIIIRKIWSKEAKKIQPSKFKVSLNKKLALVQVLN